MVRGQITLSDDAPLSVGTTAFVYVEDTGRADAPARRLGLAVVEDLRSYATSSTIPFTVEVSEPGPSPADCSLRVHISIDGDATVRSGDYVSVERAVLSDAVSGALRMRLHRVE